ncbi:MAG: glycoside hydrolase family 2 protein [Ignavibacteriales bacterium]|nr:glycoside hydrolase family 2 protein [Ignavibacteriales bacterium]
MKRIDLNGTWEFRAIDTFKALPTNSYRALDWMPAHVPGTVHTDLMMCNVIPDPYFRMNENDVQWVENIQWLYRRTLVVDETFLKEKNIALVAEGIDTYAGFKINGKEIGTTENMFVHHRFDIKRYLKSGENAIEILFDSPVVRSKALQKKHGALQVALEPHRVYARKAQYSFSWDWGPKLTTSGIWRPIYIEASSGPVLQNPFVKTLELKKKSATIELSVDIEHFSSAVLVTAKIEGEYFSEEVVKRANSSTLRFKMKIDHPNIWWPNGYGSQSLYSATFTLNDENGIVSETTTTFGIRTVELLQEKDFEGKSFIILVNGVKIFCKGADWIPSDNFIPRIPDSTYERLLRMARDANMNMIRVWGGGIYEQEIFYNLCDRLGLLVWQDFMFACGEYPHTSWFLKSVSDEAEKAVTRLRNHPSVAIWCGNNECEWLFCTENPDKTADEMTGAVIFRKLLPDAVEKLDGSRPYWRSSPYGSGFPNDESNGNHHQWQVWSFWKDYNEYETSKARFVTEFGFQAPATMKTWEECTLPEERKPQHPVIEHHNKQVEGQERLFRFQSAHYAVGEDFNKFVYQGQLVQANALKTAVEHWRRRKFNTAGALFWQLNDCWPVSSWSVIDSGLRPKAAYFYAKRFFSNVLVSLKHSGETIEVWGTNDTLETIKGTIDIRILSFTGEKHFELKKEISLKANTSSMIVELPVRGEDREFKYDRYILVRLLSNNSILSENRSFFAEPKHLHLPVPRIICGVSTKSGGEYQLNVRTDLFAKDVCIAIDGQDITIGDNYFDLDAGNSKIISCNTSEQVQDIEKKIVITFLH